MYHYAVVIILQNDGQFGHIAELFKTEKDLANFLKLVHYSYEENQFLLEKYFFLDEETRKWKVWYPV